MRKVVKRNGAFELKVDAQPEEAKTAKASHSADLAALSKPLTVEELRSIVLRVIVRINALGG